MPLAFELDFERGFGKRKSHHRRPICHVTQTFVRERSIRGRGPPSACQFSVAPLPERLPLIRQTGARTAGAVTGQHPTAIVVRAARPAGEREKQTARARGEHVSGVLEGGTVAHRLMKADPVFQAMPADLGQPARRPEKPVRNRSRITQGAKATPLARGELPPHEPNTPAWHQSGSVQGALHRSSHKSSPEYSD